MNSESRSSVNAARSLHNKAIFLARSGRHREALPLIDQAIGLLRQLTKYEGATSLSYQKELAASLIACGSMLDNTGESHRGLQIATEAADLCHYIVERVPRMWIEEFVASRCLQAIILMGDGLLLLGAKDAVKPLIIASMYASENLDQGARQYLDEVVGLLRRAYREDSDGVAKEFQRITGSPVPRWVSDSVG
ncbi:hypothetical protein Acor_80780 [Acrocarpospora corrugata]|uniref:MalT-like TPR region domain-containing protein n=1 Tax=Acrocarpospora corrugata TaxID=35763 RepID=A0A5M3WCD5_9ACTN|nr:hypothetical protein [Acrocarpospora corrugata]GES06009.1 hypothetical protein Acor_80780 [Acrocarpospora corrugata]